MVRLVAAAGALALAGCTSVRLVQREGCWIRRTEAWPGRVTEELGPCAPPSAPWSEDRVSRAVQECVARADHRWQTQAQLAWSRGAPLPAPDAGPEVYRACAEDPSKVLAVDLDQARRRSEDAERRLAEVTQERDAQEARVEDERAKREAGLAERVAAEQRLAERLLAGQEKVGDRLLQGQGAMAAYLGEAAKRPSQPAVATATATSHSDGSAAAERAVSAPAGATPRARPAGASGSPRSAPPRAACPAPKDDAAPAAGAMGANRAPEGTGVRPDTGPAPADPVAEPIAEPTASTTAPAR